MPSAENTSQIAIFATILKQNKALNDVLKTFYGGCEHLEEGDTTKRAMLLVLQLVKWWASSHKRTSCVLGAHCANVWFTGRKGCLVTQQHEQLAVNCHPFCHLPFGLLIKKRLSNPRVPVSRGALSNHIGSITLPHAPAISSLYAVGHVSYQTIRGAHACDVG